MPDWNRGGMRQELYDSGHSYLASEAERGNQMIQAGLERVLGEEDWPFQLREESVVPGVVLSGLGRIQQVLGSDGQDLEPVDLDSLRDRVGNVNDATGTPVQYYRNGTGKLGVWPTSTDAISVVHYSRFGWRSTTDVWLLNATQDTDCVALPQEWRDVPLLAARSIALDDVDEYEERDKIEEKYEVRLAMMREALIGEASDEPRRVRLVACDDFA